jgi:glutathione S-transferase
MLRTLYHYPLSPFSRKVRFTLAEKGLEFDLQVENFWERRRKFLALNPASQVPVLVEEEEGVNFSLSDSTAIVEYIEEKYPDKILIGSDINQRAEVRRVSGWFNNKFYYEVTKYLLDEIVFKFLKGSGGPNSEFLRAASENIKDHLDYIDFLTSNRSYLACDKFTMADITAAAQLSVVDYLGFVPWERNQRAKEWYMIVKSRPSFRLILEDSVAGFNPSANYKNLDF